ncbi:MAG: GNAT family N-acetyltransferase [Proteobacteria bacterium]|nr:GNAT family N-acetyltransferase [Pseudomonadota bacterium]
MHADVTIERARPEHLEAMVELLKSLFAREADFDFDPARQFQGLGLLLNDPRACVLAAEVNGETVGMCTGQLVISTAEGGPAALVEDVVVREDMQSRGLGCCLVDAVSEWAASHGVHRLQLLADHSNTSALGFYERIGWKPTNLVCLRKRQTIGVNG